MFSMCLWHGLINLYKIQFTLRSVFNPMPSQNSLQVRHLGRRDYVPVWHAMQQFTVQRTADSADEIWLVEHPPVYTQGLNGKPEHLLTPGAIPVVQTDRGGQVTYHGPGQLVAYFMLDLGRMAIGVKTLVALMEQSIIDLLSGYAIQGERRAGAPGVYVLGKKIAALGLRVRRGCTYHGLSLNVDMDLEPFSHISPCGYADLRVTQLRNLGVPDDLDRVAQTLQRDISDKLGKYGN